MWSSRVKKCKSSYWESIAIKSGSRFRSKRSRRKRVKSLRTTRPRRRRNCPLPDRERRRCGEAWEATETAEEGRMSAWDTVEPYLELLTPAGALLGPLLSIITIGWVLLTKKNSTSAVAWCLLIFFLPILGPLFFVLFGWQHVNRPLLRKRKQKKIFERTH